MIAQQLTTGVSSINVAHDIANSFYRSYGFKPIPILFKEIAGASGAFSTKNLCIYISPSFIERLKRYSEIRAFHEFYQTVRHELEHYKSYIEGARTYTKEIESHADKVSLIEATEALNKYTDEEINPLLEGMVTGLGFGAGLAASGMAVKRILGVKNPLKFFNSVKEADRYADKKGLFFEISADGKRAVVGTEKELDKFFYSNGRPTKKSIEWHYDKKNPRGGNMRNPKPKTLYQMKTRIFNHERFRKHWEYTQRDDAERYAKKLADEGYKTRITIEFQPHPSVPSGKWYVLWKKRIRSKSIKNPRAKCPHCGRLMEMHHLSKHGMPYYWCSKCRKAFVSRDVREF